MLMMDVVIRNRPPVVKNCNQISVSNAAKEDYSCSSCSFLFAKLHCSARKIVAYTEPQELDNGTIFILHNGNHSCLAKYRIHEDTKNEMEEYFKNNPNALPSVAWYNILSKKLWSQGTEKKIIQLVLLQVNDWVLSNIKSSLKSESIQSCSVGIAQNAKQNFVDSPACTKYNLIMDIVETQTFKQKGGMSVAQKSQRNKNCQETIHPTLIELIQTR